MASIDVQLQRLTRHYESSIRTYDYVSLLDLSHILRIWVEMGPELAKLKRFKSTVAFKSGCPQKSALREIKNRDFLLAYLPGGAKTFAHNGHLVSVSKASDQYTVGVGMQHKEDGSLILDCCHFVSEALESPQLKLLNKPRISRGNYANWLGAEVARYRLAEPNGNVINDKISRGSLIKRVANSMDGLHSSIAGHEESTNKYDKPLGLLMDFKVGGLSFPYFVLLHAARTVIGKFPASR